MPALEKLRMEFASPEWLAFFARLLVARAAILDTPDGVTCEVYRNVPAHLSETGRLAWTRRVEGRVAHVEFVECPDDEADMKIIGDYAALLPLARYLIGDDTAEFEELMRSAVESAAVEIVSDRRDPETPRDFTVHNLMAVLTR